MPRPTIEIHTQPFLFDIWGQIIQQLGVLFVQHFIWGQIIWQLRQLKRNTCNLKCTAGHWYGAECVWRMIEVSQVPQPTLWLSSQLENLTRLKYDCRLVEYQELHRCAVFYSSPDCFINCFNIGCARYLGRGEVSIKHWVFYNRGVVALGLLPSGDRYHNDL